ncbi:MAG TPA: hypothetical protein VJK29_16665 [Terriglobales bacterium]|nr:hypothetical protein [Terriglobales bacterium]
MTVHALRSTLLMRLGCVNAYRLSLDVSYGMLIPVADYYAVTKIDIDGAKVLESYVLGSLVSALIPRDPTRLSVLFVWLFVVLSYVPMLSVFALQNESRILMYATTLFWIGVFALLRFTPRLRLTPLDRREAGALYLGWFLATVAVSVVLTQEYLGFDVVLDLSKVYDVRARFAEAGLPVHGYYLHWLASFFVPVLLAVAVVRRRWVGATSLVCLQLIIASVVGQKFYYFLVPLALGLMWILTRGQALEVLELSLAGMTLLSWLIYEVSGNLLLYLFAVVRWLVLPAQLNFLYYDFFSENRLLYFSHVVELFLKLPYLWPYPYSLYPANLIGAVYLDNPNIVAVTGLIGDAYMNLGLWGFVVYGVALVGVLRVLDACSARLDIRVGIAAIAMPAVSFIGTFSERALITYGFLPSLLFLYLLGSALRERNVQQGLPIQAEPGVVGGALGAEGD